MHFFQVGFDLRIALPQTGITNTDSMRDERRFTLAERTAGRFRIIHLTGVWKIV